MDKKLGIDLDEDKSRVRFHCRKCNKRLFDYISGDLQIEMKCDRCKRVLVLKNYTEAAIRAQAVDGIFKV